MWYKILVPIIGNPVMVSGFWSLEAGKITWYKILVPIIGFAIILFIFLLIQCVIQIAFNFFKRMREAK